MIRVHGGGLEAARRQFPAAPEPFLDLSTGINPIPYPMPKLPESCFTRLPEPEAEAALRAAAAAAYGVADPELVVAAPGTQSLIQLLPRLLPPARVAVVGPTYGEHAACWRDAGHTVREVACLDEASGFGVTVLCNPNNPDGRRVAAADLRGFARGCGLLVVDEAFADFEPAGFSVACDVPCGGLLVLRSFGKAYGLAGLRLGFAVAPPDLAAMLRRALGSWAVSGAAIAAGIAALGDGSWRVAAGLRLARDAARLDALLSRAGLEVTGGTSLFRLARHAEAQAIFARLGRAGLLVRRFAGQPDWLRFGIPEGESAFGRLEAVTSPDVV